MTYAEVQNSAGRSALVHASGMTEAQLEAAGLDLALDVNRFVAHQCLPNHYRQLFRTIIIPVAAWLARDAARQPRVPLLVGLSGAQGAGKSTFGRALALALERLFRLPSCMLSIDNFYCTREERDRMADEVHPLLRTRGVPGTHDVALLEQVLADLAAAGDETETLLPVFDKAENDRKPTEEWPAYRGRPAVILLEGWCIGATPQSDEALSAPINALETEEDADGRWRKAVNAQLAGPYRQLFARLQRLIYLQVPDWNAVTDWRTVQENQLLAQLPSGKRYSAGLADFDRMQRFLQHYERLTRHQFDTLSQTADLVLELDRRHQVAACSMPGGTQP